MIFKTLNIFLLGILKRIPQVLIEGLTGWPRCDTMVLLVREVLDVPIAQLEKPLTLGRKRLNVLDHLANLNFQKKTSYQ